MAKKKADKILGQSQSRADLISDMMDKFEELVNNYSTQLSDIVINQFVDTLSTEAGTILTSEENIRKVALIDKAWSIFNNQQGMKLVTTLIDDLESINNENLKYYRSLSDAQIKPGDIKNIINSRLGLDKDGVPVKGGYMKGLMDDTSVRDQIKKYAYQRITGSNIGHTDFTKGLREMIAGSPETMGAFEQFHRNFSFDIHANIDRLNGALYAEKLKLKYFIFQGTRRKGSRYFCLQRKGKVFSTEEAEGWKDLIGKKIVIPGVRKKTRSVLIGPIVDSKATYTPVVDMGGFGCVDIPSYISEEIAFYMRPDLKTKISVSEDYAVHHEGKDKAKVYVHADADKKDLAYNIDKAKILADNGIAVKIRKHADSKGAKNPELQFADGKLGDFKEPLKNSNIKTALNNVIKSANTQGAQVPVIVLTKSTYNKAEVIRGLNGSLIKGRNRNITDITLVISKVVIHISREDIALRNYYDRLP